MRRVRSREFTLTTLASQSVENGSIWAEKPIFKFSQHPGRSRQAFKSETPLQDHGRNNKST